MQPVRFIERAAGFQKTNIKLSIEVSFPATEVVMTEQRRCSPASGDQSKRY
jgi:hypothetical protein